MAVEVTTRYATTVDSLPAAWAFVMERVDSVGPSPSISIDPMWVYNYDEIDGDSEGTLRFEVVVAGMIEEKTDGE